MFHAYNKKSEKKNNGRNRTAKSGKNQNTWREKNFKYLEILEADTIKQAEIEKKKKNWVLQKSKKTSGNQALQLESCNENND